LIFLTLIFIRELLDYVANLADNRLEEPQDDLISKLCTEQVKPGNIEKADAVQISFLLFVAGNAMLVNMIALVRISDPAFL
jgi:fungal nitric oxide reductase